MGFLFLVCIPPLLFLPSSFHRLPNITHPTSHTQHQTPNITHPISNTKHHTLNITHSTSTTQHHTLNVTHPTSHTLNNHSTTTQHHTQHHTLDITHSTSHTRHHTLDITLSASYTQHHTQHHTHSTSRPSTSHKLTHSQHHTHSPLSNHTLDIHTLKSHIHARSTQRSRLPVNNTFFFSNSIRQVKPFSEEHVPTIPASVKYAQRSISRLVQIICTKNLHVDHTIQQIVQQSNAASQSARSQNRHVNFHSNTGMSSRTKLKARSRSIDFF